MAADGGPRSTRPYDGARRRAQASETRRRIIEAAAELAREQPSWDWSGVTMTAVAERAGVGRRTVYRHVESQAALHAALEEHLLREGGVDYTDLRIDDVPDVAARVFAGLGTFAATPWAVLPPVHPAIDEERRAGLRRAAKQAVEDGGGDPAVDVEDVAAVLDVLWQVSSYELLLRDWGVDPDRAVALLRWVHDLVVRDLRR